MNASTRGRGGGTPRECAFLPCSHLDFESAVAAQKDESKGSFHSSYSRLLNLKTLRRNCQYFFCCFFRARKNSCRTCCYEVRCREALWLQVRKALWSNCKGTPSSESRFVCAGNMNCWFARCAARTRACVRRKPSQITQKQQNQVEMIHWDEERPPGRWTSSFPGSSGEEPENEDGNMGWFIFHGLDSTPPPQGVILLESWMQDVDAVPW